MKIVKIFDWFTRLLPLWVVLCGIFAYFYPVVFIPFKSYMELAFALTMLGISLVLNYEEFISVFRKPQMVILGILAQFAIMPALGFFIAKLFNFPPNYTLALVLVGSVPGAIQQCHLLPGTGGCCLLDRFNQCCNIFSPFLNTRIYLPFCTRDC